MSWTENPMVGNYKSPQNMTSNCVLICGIPESPNRSCDQRGFYMCIVQLQQLRTDKTNFVATIICLWLLDIFLSGQ